MDTHRRVQSGFTFIELLVAIVVLSLGLLAVAGMQVTAIRGNASANVISTKTAVAESILEQILSWSIQDPRLDERDEDIDWFFSSWDTDQEAGDSESDPSDLALVGAGSYAATYRLQNTAVSSLIRVEVVVRSGRSGVLTTLVGFKRTI
jgi:type IV pilus assembly protein PilV